ncbi:MAG: 2-oxo acid dehydrogenase subunit E2, partial [Anaerolineales bacterium]|nr:2-oxo acid dehydrogenase subunit E2 [Anaerolineales bacterium]
RPKISPAARKRAQELGVDLSQLSGEVISLADVEQAAAKKAAPAAAPHITPVARKMAEKLGVDWQQLTGTGSHGAICKEDVERAAQPEAAPVPATKPEPRTEPADFQTGMRRAIARAMARANADIPHYYLETRINMAPALAWLEGENQKRPLKDRLLTAVLLIKAVARALGEVPALNGYWRDDEHQPQEAIHIGFAIALRQGGLIAPAIHHADLKSLDELMAALRDLIMRTRNGRLRGSEMTDATITLTNLGDLGVEKVFGVIYPPQVALVGFGKISDQVWVENGMIGVRPVLTATLAADHRATDGRIGGKFLDLLKKYLEEPAWMGQQ